MVKRLLFVCAMLTAAYPVAASTIVTWGGSGQVTLSNPLFPDFPDDPHYQPAPPVGTPLSLTVSFDRDAVFQTTGGSGQPLPGCMRVPASGSLMLGGYSYGLIGDGFTNALLPGTNCAQGDAGRTQFGLHIQQQQADTPWDMRNRDGILVVSYRDQLVTDTFPASPTTGVATIDWMAFPGALTWTFGGRVGLNAVDQMTPVPEPGTLTLLGLGLAAAYRKRRASGAS